MAGLRLPQFLTDRNAESREMAVLRFAEDNNDILRKQFAAIAQISNTLKNIESMVFLMLDIDKRRIHLEQERLQTEELQGLEDRRERDNARNQSRNAGGGGSLASAVGKVGLKGMLGAFLFGFGMELLRWGKTLAEFRDKIAKTLEGIQNILDAWGDKVEELTGSKALGGIVRSLLFIGSALASIRVLFGPKAFAPIRAVFGFLGDLFEFAKSSKIVQSQGKIGTVLRGIFGFFEMLIKPFAMIGRLLGFVGEGGQLAKTIGVFGKLFNFVKVFAKVLGPIGIVISVIEGIVGAFKGFQEGFEQGGILGGIKEGFIGLIDGLVGGLVDMFADLLGWILKQLGFEELGEKFSAFNFKAFFGTIVDQVTYGFQMIGWLFGKIPAALKGIVKSILDNVPDVLQRFIPDGLRGWANSKSESSAMPAMPAPRKAAAEAAPTPKVQVAKAVAAPGPAPTGGGATPTAGPSVDTNFTSNLGAPAMTGNMTGGTAGAAQRGAVRTGAPLRGNAAAGEAAVKQVAQAEGITDPTELNAFLSQVQHESGNYRYMEEIWGPTAAQKRYEGRSDLGNNQPGDGYRYRGRGYIQLTGRANYAAFSRDTGIDAVNNPDIVATPGVAAKAALWYWKKRVRSRVRNFGDVTAVTKAVNGGTNGLADRQANFARLQGGGSAAPAPSRSMGSGSALQTATAAVSAPASGMGGGGTVAVNAPRINNTTNQTHQNINVSASTPVEFAPHVV